MTVRKSDGMTLTIDMDRVTFHAIGQIGGIPIMRPKQVSVVEWQAFWGGDEKVKHKTGRDLEL